jgi:hypothetical protein
MDRAASMNARGRMASPACDLKRLDRKNRSRMDNQEKRAVTRSEWIATLAFVLSAAGVVFQVGVVWGTVQNHEQRISRQEEKMDIVAVRVERIDANVSFLAEQAREERDLHP